MNQILFSPLNSAILEPDFNLCFVQPQVSSKVKSLSTNYILLTVELIFKPLQLVCGEDCAVSLPFVSSLRFQTSVFAKICDSKVRFLFHLSLLSSDYYLRLLCVSQVCVQYVKDERYSRKAECSFFNKVMHS